MLYPQKELSYQDDWFQSPSSEYRGAPFWAWNSRLDKNELLWQIEQLKKMGYGGFHIHVRTGMATQYLSDEYMELVKACAEKAREEGMLCWLYDEDRWPSGAAGGYVTKNPDYRQRHLLLTRTPYAQGGAARNTAVSSGQSVRTGNGRLLACFDVQLDGAGCLAGYSTIEPGAPAKGFALYAYEETALPSPWFNNQTYVDTLNPAAMREFIQVTYERYAGQVSKNFGGLIPAIFTDEPQFAHKGTLAFAREEKDVTLPWTGDLPETYQAAYGGESLVAHLPELLWELPTGVSLVRYHYHDHIAERFSSAFADQCGAWCGQHGLMLTGHMMEEPTLQSQTAALGEAMRSYRSFGLPGIDMLCDWREFTTAKQAQSAARQYGRPGVLSELYGVTNWDFDFRGHKLQGDWQAALGVTVRVPHLSWVSMNGEAKRDYPSTFNYQSPWFEQYPYLENHFARVNTALTRGKAVCRIGVIHPVESYWLHWGSREATQSIRRQMDENFHNLTHWLLDGLLDFDYIAESLLPEQCAPERITQAVFLVGDMAYDTVLVPPMETMRATTLARLEAFAAKGGRIVFLGGAPALVDAVPHERGARLSAQCERLPFERIALLEALAPLRELTMQDATGAAAIGFVYQMRADGEERWLFLAHSDLPENKDLPAQTPPTYRIKLRGEYSAALYDTLSGGREPLASRVENGWTVLDKVLYEHSSLLLRLSPRRAETAQPQTQAQAAVLGTQCFLKPVPVTLHEPNVLLLDMAEAALDGEAYRPVNEVLRLDNALRAELGWPLRGEAFAQPWVENDETTPHRLRLRYTFTSLLAVKKAKLALENAAAATVLVNGEPAGAADGWYVDKCIQTVSLPALRAGENTIEISMSYGKKVDVEACYLLGDFGVTLQGCQATLTPPITALSFGDITRQGLPFYGGNLTYHMQFETCGNALAVEASYYRSPLLTLAVDGQEKGAIAFSPYRLTVNGLAPGRHTVDLTCYGCRINTFGQLHTNDRVDTWWGPDAWRTSGPAWTWEYRLWQQGVLKTPEISDCEL